MKKYYVVWKGRNPGIYTDWDTCRKQIDTFAGAKYKSYKTLSEAETAFSGDHADALTKARAEKAAAPKKIPSIKTIKTYTAAEISALKAEIKIFTDGACDPNPGEAGSGIAVYYDDVLCELWYGMYDACGTNNTAELNALHQALKMAEKHAHKERTVMILCDSKYSIQCITQWAVGWQKKGWIKTGGEIKNLELIQEIFALYQSMKNVVKVLHVNGHVGVEGNELADRMSMEAIRTKEAECVRFHKPYNLKTILAMRTG